MYLLHSEIIDVWLLQFFTVTKMDNGIAGALLILNISPPSTLVFIRYWSFQHLNQSLNFCFLDILLLFSMILSVTLSDGAERCTWYCVVRNIHNQDSAPAPSARPNPSDLTLVSLEPLYFWMKGLKVFIFYFTEKEEKRETIIYF